MPRAASALVSNKAGKAALLLLHFAAACVLGASSRHEFENGVMYVLGTNTPLISYYKDRWAKLGGRGPYLKEITASASSVRRHSPSVPIALVTDAGDLPHDFKILFDVIIPFDGASVKGGWGDKIVACGLTPFKRTLFLDADTVTCDDVRPMFKLLDDAHLAMVREPFLVSGNATSIRQRPLPDGVYYMNSGMMLFRKHSPFDALLADWKVTHDAASEGNSTGSIGDQELLPKLLQRHYLRFLQLPFNFNLRFNSNIAPMIIQGKVVILHTRDRRQGRTCEVVNKYTGLRLQHPVWGYVPVQGLSNESFTL